MLRTRWLNLSDFQRQITALSRSFFGETWMSPAIPNPDVAFRATITDPPFGVGKIKYQQAVGNRSSHQTTISARAAFKNTQELRLAAIQFISVEEIPIGGTSGAVVQVHGGFLHIVSIQISVGHGIYAISGACSRSRSL
jgi:hypothetical protein